MKVFVAEIVDFDGLVQAFKDAGVVGFAIHGTQARGYEVECDGRFKVAVKRILREHGCL